MFRFQLEATRHFRFEMFDFIFLETLSISFRKSLLAC
jgi:hypothetical protein